MKLYQEYKGELIWKNTINGYYLIFTDEGQFVADTVKAIKKKINETLNS